MANQSNPVAALWGVVAACGVAQAQIHGVQEGVACPSPRCVNGSTACRTLIANSDGFGDTLVVTAVWYRIEPAIWVNGDLLIAIEGNAFCTDAGGACESDGAHCALPCYLGAPFSTLSGLPGASLRGFIQLREDQYVIQPDDPNPLFVQSNVEVHDLCDSPTTVGCSTVPGLRQVAGLSHWCPDPSPDCGGCNAEFQACMAGPASAPNPPYPFVAADCTNAFDLNFDGRVDLVDFAIVQIKWEE